MRFGDSQLTRTLCDAYNKELESHWRSILDKLQFVQLQLQPRFQGLSSNLVPSETECPLSQRDRVTSFSRRLCDLVPRKTIFPKETMGTTFLCMV